MIKINLLPEELKKRRMFNTYVLTLLGIGVGVFLIVVVIALLLVVQVKVQAKRYHRLSEEWKIIEQEEREVLELEKLRAELDEKRRAIEDLSQSRLLWSRKLYQLSRQVSPSIWLTDLSMSSRTEKVKVPIETGRGGRRKETTSSTVTWVIKTFKTLVLKGVVISLAGEEMIDSIGKFMTSLKNDQEFFQDFCDIELIVTQKRTVQDREAMAFELTCNFK